VFVEVLETAVPAEEDPMKPACTVVQAKVVDPIVAKVDCTVDQVKEGVLELV